MTRRLLLLWNAADRLVVIVARDEGGVSESMSHRRDAQNDNNSESTTTPTNALLGGIHPGQSLALVPYHQPPKCICASPLFQYRCGNDMLQLLSRCGMRASYEK